MYRSVKMDISKKGGKETFFLVGGGRKQKRQLLLSCRLFNEDTAATSCLEVTDVIPPRIEAEKKIIDKNGWILQ